MTVAHNLKIGAVYSVRHQRKGLFKAQLIDVVKTLPGDEQDEVFLRMKIDTRPGTGQGRLVRAPGPVTVTDIRPSLVSSIEEIPDEDYLVNVRVVEEEQPKQAALPRESVWDKIRGALRIH